MGDAENWIRKGLKKPEAVGGRGKSERM